MNTIIRWLRNVFGDERAPLCPECGREMSRGYRGPNIIVWPMCPCPHPITHIPRIEV